MNWTLVVAKINHISVSYILHALDASNHGCNKMMIRTTDTDVHSVSCANHYFIAAMVGSIQGMQNVADTDVVNFSHY